MIKSNDTPKAGQWTRRFRVEVNRGKLQDFSRVISRNSDHQHGRIMSVPLTFPAIWYAMPEVQDFIIGTVQHASPDSRVGLLHMEQTIEVLHHLTAGEDYNLDLEVQKLNDAKQLKVLASVSCLQEVQHMSLSSLFAVLDSPQPSP